MATGGRLNVRATSTRLALFLVQGLLVTALIFELRRARRVAELQAREAQVARRETESAGRMKDEFLATISHGCGSTASIPSSAGCTCCGRAS